MSEEAINAVGDYKYGFHDPEKATIRFDKGLSEQVVRDISELKGEPEWMTEIRVKAYHHFEERPMPDWGNCNMLESIKFDDVTYFLRSSEQTEKNSNQILEFTKEIKNKDEEFKIKIVEALWKIIYADNVSDMYEMSLMRRLTGLLYLDTKIVGDIKNKIINSSNK